MPQEQTTIHPFAPADRPRILQIWEASVRATHDFLKPEDIGFYKRLLEEFDFGTLRLHCLRHGSGIAGFVGVADDTIEMLFLAPDAIGKGFGRRLLDFAVDTLGAVAVDVNEQNQRALRFYERSGFGIVGRTPTDSFGKPYPILQLRLPDGHITR